MTRLQSKMKTVWHCVITALLPDPKNLALPISAALVLHSAVSFVLLAFASGGHVSATNRPFSTLLTDVPTWLLDEPFIYFAHVGYTTERLLGLHTAEAIFCGVYLYAFFITASSLYYNGVEPLLDDMAKEDGDD